MTSKSTNPTQYLSRTGFRTALVVAGEEGTFVRPGTPDQTWPVRVIVSQPFEKAHGNLMVKSNRYDILAPHDWKVSVDVQQKDRIDLKNGRSFVIAIGPSDEPWVWSDGNQTFRRLHTRELSLDE